MSIIPVILAVILTFILGWLTIRPVVGLAEKDHLKRLKELPGVKPELKSSKE